MTPLTKHRIKKVLSILGIRARISGMPHRNMREFLDHIRNHGFRPATVIDVGVADGTFDLYEAFPEARHLLVEPMFEFEGALRFICRHYFADYKIAAAGDYDGVTSINFSGDLHGASLLKEVTGEQAVSPQSREVPMVKLDTLVAEYDIEKPVLIKVDVQGAELSVLEGAKALLPRTEIVILETSLFRFKEDGPILDEVVAYMKDYGFVTYDIFGGHTRPLDGALAQMDFAFVKQNGRFRNQQIYATENQLAARNRKLISRVRRILKI